MRALIVGSARSATGPNIIAALAAKCDVVFAADGGGGACLSAGVIPDLVVGDLDSLAVDDETRLREAGVGFLTAHSEKDVTDLDLALAEARNARVDEVWVTGVLGGRIDHSLATIGSLARHAEARPPVYEPELSAWVLALEGSTFLALRGKGSLVSVFAVGGAAAVSLHGFRYNLSYVTLPSLDSRGLSNVIELDEASVEVFGGIVLVTSFLADGAPLAWDPSFDRRTQ